MGRFEGRGERGGGVEPAEEFQNPGEQPVVNGHNVEAQENQHDEQNFCRASRAGKPWRVLATDGSEHFIALTRIHNVSQGSPRLFALHQSPAAEMEND